MTRLAEGLFISRLRYPEAKTGPSLISSILMCVQDCTESSRFVRLVKRSTFNMGIKPTASFERFHMFTLYLYQYFENFRKKMG